MSRCPECGTKECCGASMSEELAFRDKRLAELEKELSNLRPVVEAARNVKIAFENLDANHDQNNYSLNLNLLISEQQELFKAIRKLDGGE